MENLKEMIKSKLLSESKSNSGGNSRIVINDRKEKGIYGTDASRENIRFGTPSVIAIIDRDAIYYHENNKIATHTSWYWGDYELITLDQLVQRIADVWES